MTTRLRDPWLDNAKMLLVTLVVVGHTWGLLSDTGETNWVYDWLYFWHIPAFVVISGYLSRTFAWDRRHLKALVYTILLPYLVFEPLLYYYRLMLGQHESGLLWIHPHWSMWYLVVLFWWRLGTPILKRHWLWIPLAVVISLLSGLISEPASGVFYVSRIMGLLPFFVLGLHLTPQRLARLHDPWVKVAAVGSMVGIFALARFTDEWVRTAFLWYDAGYDDLGLDAAPAAQARLAVMAIGLVGAFAVLALVPRRDGWFARMGAATMIVYLGHGFVVKGLEATGLVADLSADRPLLAVVLTAVFAVGVSLLLASPPSRRWLIWAVNPVGTWGKRRRAAQSSTGGPHDGSTADRGTESSPDASRLSGA